MEYLNIVYFSAKQNEVMLIWFHISMLESNLVSYGFHLLTIGCNVKSAPQLILVTFPLHKN